MQNTFLILLRGINVGGNNIIKMANLREQVEKLGYEQVKTYIQTGNVFVTTKDKKEVLEKKMKKMLKQEFNYELPILILTQKELDSIIKQVPTSFGKNFKKYRYDVWFLIPPLTASKVIKEVELKEGVDSIEKGKKALYATRLIAKATQSKLTKIIQKPVYKSLTIRNWNTTTKLQGLIDTTN